MRAESGRLFGLSPSAGSADVVEGNGAAAEEDKGECEGGQSEREFGSAVADQSVVDMHLGYGHGKIDADGKSSYASEKAQQDEQPAKEFGERREIRGPGGESEAGDELGMVVKSAENLLVPVVEHDSAQGKAHEEKSEGLQAIEVAQGVPPAERK